MASTHLSSSPHRARLPCFPSSLHSNQTTTVSETHRHGWGGSKTDRDWRQGLNALVLYTDRGYEEKIYTVKDGGQGWKQVLILPSLLGKADIGRLVMALR